MNKKKLTTAKFRAFRKQVYTYYRAHGRKLPWRTKITPYRVFISEIMLQQTQVDRVVPKFLDFIKQFPTFVALAQSPLAAVLEGWSGLGYNRRALALQQAAKMVVTKHGNRLPADPDILQTLPGIGPATAAAMAAYAFNQPVEYVENNIRTVYLHFFFKNRNKVHDDEIIPLVRETLDCHHPRRWYSALMDYGVMLKQKYGNTNRRSAHYVKQTPFAGSHRQLRGRVLKILIQKKSASTQALLPGLGETARRIDRILRELQTEGFVSRHNTCWHIT